MLSRRAKLAIAKFLTGMVNREDLKEYNDDIDDNGLAIFIQLVDAQVANTAVQVAVHDASGITVEELQFMNFCVEHWANGTFPDDLYNLAMGHNHNVTDAVGEYKAALPGSAMPWS